jgi:hypothetical protein
MVPCRDTGFPKVQDDHRAVNDPFHGLKVTLEGFCEKLDQFGPCVGKYFIVCVLCGDGGRYKEGLFGISCHTKLIVEKSGPGS